MANLTRFAARFKPFGFKVAHTTHQLMKQMVISGEVDALISERVFKEILSHLIVNRYVEFHFTAYHNY
jgi:tRNA nucleotidyltransferase (CCA-adding enzyme)